MKKLACGFVVLLTVVGILGMVTPAMGQEVTAAIVGTVTDPSGAPIKGATVKATDMERGTVWTAETNESGAYNLLRLPIGSYGVKVTAPGFQTTEWPAFTLLLNQTARVSVQLKVGKISETVEVSSSAPVLQTENAEVGTVLDARTNDNLPLATRNYVQLTLLTPGTVSVDPASMNLGSNTAEEGGRPYINGNREQSNNFLLDGVDNNQASDNLLGFTPSPDAIGEFNLITQNAPAEFGNYNGGIVNAVIKSGTNRYHGDVFEFFRNDFFNANTWADGLTAGTPAGVLPTPKLRWNMFGGTFGGPIIKNKLFFFADYQGGRLDHPASSSTITVLTAAEIGGNFSALSTQLYNACAVGTGGTSGTPCSILPPASRPAFTGNMISPANLDPAFTSLVTNSLYPVSVFTLPSGFGQAVNTTAQQYNSDQGDIKVDYNASNKDHIFVRYSKGDQYDPATNSVALLGNTVNEAYLDNGALNWTHTFSPNLLNEARFGKNYVKLPHGLTTFAPSVGTLGNSIGIAGGNPSGINGLPELGFAGGSITNINSGTLTNLGAADVVEKFSSTVTQFDDVLIYTHGRHVIKTGFQTNRYNINVFYTGNGGELGAELFGLGPGGNYSGNGTGGDPSADWALGVPEDVGRGTSSGGWHQRDSLFAGFVQDDWRITDRLTLNLGLRYEARTPWIELNNRQAAVNIQTGALEFPGSTAVPTGVVGSNGFSRGLYNSNYGLPDIQPRLGFAWSPAAWQGKTVVRGAFTISSYLEGTGTNLRLTQNPPFTPPQVEASNVATGTAYSTESAFSAAAPPTGDPFIGATMLTWGSTVQPAVADQWNLSIQQQLANNLTFQVGYVGQRTTHLMVPEWLSQGDLQANGSVTYPLIGGQNPAGTIINGVTTGSVTYGPNGFGNVKNTASVGNMNYNALQAVLQKRYSHGLEAQVSYSFEKCMTNDDGYYGTWGATTQAGPSGNYWQNLYNPNGDYARCYWDSTNVLSAYAVYELPFGRGKQFGQDMPPALNAVVGNWSINPIISWHSGFPLSLYGAGNSGTGSPENRPDCNGPVTYPKTVSVQGIQWFGQGSFSNAAPGTFGNCPAQGPVIGPGYADADISLQKNFPITEAMKVQFRADFLNAFNHPNFAVPNDSCCTGTFGVSSSTQDARELQFALKFYW
ncbi:MAG: TonB-dependent receptor [Candidatus Sulfotelmatobacter sp.]